MSNILNNNLFRSNIGFIDNTVVSNSNPIKGISTCQFDGLMRKWIGY